MRSPVHPTSPLSVQRATRRAPAVLARCRWRSLALAPGRPSSFPETWGPGRPMLGRGHGSEGGLGVRGAPRAEREVVDANRRGDPARGRAPRDALPAAARGGPVRPDGAAPAVPLARAKAFPAGALARVAGRGGVRAQGLVRAGRAARAAAADGGRARVDPRGVWPPPVAPRSAVRPRRRLHAPRPAGV